jgi:hypothetical protein
MVKVKKKKNARNAVSLCSQLMAKRRVKDQGRHIKFLACLGNQVCYIKLLAHIALHRQFFSLVKKLFTKPETFNAYRENL